MNILQNALLDFLLPHNEILEEVHEVTEHHHKVFNHIIPLASDFLGTVHKKFKGEGEINSLLLDQRNHKPAHSLTEKYLPGMKHVFSNRCLIHIKVCTTCIVASGNVSYREWTDGLLTKNLY